MVLYALKILFPMYHKEIYFSLLVKQLKSCKAFYLVCILFLVLGNTSSNGWAEKGALTPLKQIDVLFRGTYNQTRSDVLKDAGPIILASGEDLTLLYGGEKIKGVAPPAGYRALTTVSHITLTIFLLLEPYGEGDIAEDRLEKLEQLSRLALAAKPTVAESLAFDPSLAEGQQNLIDTCRRFIEKIVGKRDWISKELSSFLQTVKPQILTNVQRAAKFRIDHFHTQMVSWKKTMGEEEWKRMHVVVLGAAMPRKNNLAVQYFSKLFGVRGEGLKITYAESIFSDQRALQILGTNLLDTQIGEGYFADPWRMHHDLLGNAAAVYLDGLTLSGADH